MNSEQITAFLQEHWNWVTLIIGAVLLTGAIMNWNWLCDPTGKPDSHRYGRGSRRVIFFLLGIVLIVASIWSLVMALNSEAVSHDPRRTDPPLSADGKAQLVFPSRDALPGSGNGGKDCAGVLPGDSGFYIRHFMERPAQRGTGAVNGRGLTLNEFVLAEEVEIQCQ